MVRTADRFTQIGFSQRIRIEWLEQTANLVLAGCNRKKIFALLQDMLQDKLSVGGDAERGTREKAITILMKVWVSVPPELEYLRDAGLRLLRELPPYERLTVHWGMSMAVYPFFGAVAGSVGRLLRLQGTAAAAHVQRRVREKYGERETVSRATRRVLRTFVDWGVLAEGTEAGVYMPGRIQTIRNRPLAVWLIEALLHTSQEGRSSLRAILDSPTLFPFKLERVPSDGFARSERIEVIRYGLDEDWIMLRNPNFSTP